MLGEVPLFDGASETFSDGGSLHIDELTQLEVTWSQAESNGQEVLWTHSELSHVGLRRQVVLKEVSDLGLGDLGGVFLANTDLNGVDAILSQSFDLRHLAAVQLDDCAGDHSAPFVPEVCHAD